MACCFGSASRQNQEAALKRESSIGTQPSAQAPITALEQEEYLTCESNKASETVPVCALSVEQEEYIEVREPLRETTDPNFNLPAQAENPQQHMNMAGSKLNPDYAPSTLTANPDYAPSTLTANPDYAPSTLTANPDYAPSTLTANPDYAPSTLTANPEYAPSTLTTNPEYAPSKDALYKTNPEYAVEQSKINLNCAGPALFKKNTDYEEVGGVPVQNSDYQAIGGVTDDPGYRQVGAGLEYVPVLQQDNVEEPTFADAAGPTSTRAQRREAAFNPPSFVTSSRPVFEEVLDDSHLQGFDKSATMQFLNCAAVKIHKIK